LVRNRMKVASDIKLAMDRIEEAPVALYRKVVWEIFTRIVNETPQFTGRAVANWNLGINSPDLSFDPNMGDEHDTTASGRIRSDSGRHKGDQKWAVEATQRAKNVLRRIRRGDKVYITNATRGDSFGRGDQSSAAYLADRQNPANWAKRLREVNKPYETALESAIFVAEGLLKNGTMPLAGLDEG